MKGKILYLISIILIALPWLFLFELWPISYSQMGTLVEVLIEGSMFALLLVDMRLLRKEIKRLKVSASDKTASKHKLFYKITGRILFVLASITMVILGLVLLLIGISFTL